MSYVPPLTVLRDAVVRRIRTIMNSDALLNPVNTAKSNIVMEAVEENDPTPASLVAASVMVPNGTCGLKPLGPLSSPNPLDYSAFQFGQGNLGWHFLYGSMGDVGFTLMFFRVELTTPHVLREMDISPENGVMYSICAGFGKRGGEWTTLPPTSIQGSYVSGDQSFSFNAITDSNSPWLKTFTISQKKGLTNVNIQWSASDGSLVGYSAVLIPSKAPVYQGPKGCMPCVGGQGTLYWSIPMMSVSGSIGRADSPIVGSGGTGWYDHQWMGSGGMLSNKILQLISLVSSSFAVPKVIRWLWLTLQLPNDLQYMISVILDGLPQQGTTYNTTSITKIAGNETNYGVKGTVKIESMVGIEHQIFPDKYTIEIEGNTYGLQSAFGNSGVYLPSGVLNWEGPGDVLDGNGNLIGVGFLEANQLDTDEGLLAVQSSRAGIDPSKLSLLAGTKTSIWSGIVAMIILGLIMLVLVMAIILAGKGAWSLVNRK